MEDNIGGLAGQHRHRAHILLYIGGLAGQHRHRAHILLHIGGLAGQHRHEGQALGCRHEGVQSSVMRQA